MRKGRKWQGKRKGKKSTQQQEAMMAPEEETETDKEKPKQGKGFFACYLLTSLCPRFKGRTYIGYTVNPRRRIRQHNGEITSGAFRTKKHRPWEMVLCIYGFPTNVSALQFEWAWQHPKESVAVRQAAAAFKTFSGVANKMKLAYTMLNLPPWHSLNIVVNYFSTNYTKHYASCPSLPQRMKVQFRPMDELPCYSRADASSFQDEDAQYGWGEDDEKVTNSSESVNMEELLHCPNSVPWDSSGEDFLFQGKDGKCDRYEEQQENNESIGKNISDTSKDMQSDTTNHISAECANSIKDASYEHFRWHEDHGNRQQWHPHTTEADCVQPIGFLESIAKTKPSFLTTFSTEEAEVDRQQSVGFVDSLAKTTPLFVMGSSKIEIEDDRASMKNGTTQEMPSGRNIHVSAEYAKSIDEWFSEHFSCYEHSKRQQMDPPMSVVDHNHMQPIDVLDSPFEATHAVVSGLTPIQIRDDSPLTFNEDSFTTFNLIKSTRFTLKEAADKPEPTYVGSGYQEIEVINLLSPSSECRIKSNNKKNIASVFCPQIIDLT